MIKPRCDNCQYSYLTALGGGQIQCRRYPPTILALPVQTAQGMVIQPSRVMLTMEANDSCGEFKAKGIQIADESMVNGLRIIK